MKAPEVRCRIREVASSPCFWMNLQTRYDLELEKDRLGSRLDVEFSCMKRLVEVNHSPAGAGSYR